jgi:hypothetical protein
MENRNEASQKNSFEQEQTEITEKNAEFGFPPPLTPFAPVKSVQVQAASQPVRISIGSTGKTSARRKWHSSP